MTTQTEAKRFFVDKVVGQAHVEKMALTEAERAMLSWSESDPDYKVDPALPVRLNAEISDEEYEAKIAALLSRSFERDRGSNPDAEQQWRHALRVLNEGDHYIAIMLDAAVDRRWKSWWQKALGRPSTRRAKQVAARGSSR